MMQFGIGERIEMNRMKNHSHLLAEFLNESLIAVGLTSTEMEIAMHSVHTVAHLEHHHEQRHAVGASTHSCKIQLTTVEEPVTVYILFYSFKHPLSLFHVEHQALKILSFGMIDIYRMVGWLVQLMQNPHLPTRLCSSGEHCISEILLGHHLTA